MIEKKSQVRFFFCKKAEYLALTKKIPSALYFITDTGEIFLDGKTYGTYRQNGPATIIFNSNTINTSDLPVEIANMFTRLGARFSATLTFLSNTTQVTYSTNNVRVTEIVIRVGDTRSRHKALQFPTELIQAIQNDVNGVFGFFNYGDYSLYSPIEGVRVTGETLALDATNYYAPPVYLNGNPIETTCTFSEIGEEEYDVCLDLLTYSQTAENYESETIGLTKDSYYQYEGAITTETTVVPFNFSYKVFDASKYFPSEITVENGVLACPIQDVYFTVISSETSSSDYNCIVIDRGTIVGGDQLDYDATKGVIMPGPSGAISGRTFGPISHTTTSHSQITTSSFPTNSSSGSLNLCVGDWYKGEFVIDSTTVTTWGLCREYTPESCPLETVTSISGAKVIDFVITAGEEKVRVYDGLHIESNTKVSGGYRVENINVSDLSSFALKDTL